MFRLVSPLRLRCLTSSSPRAGGPVRAFSASARVSAQSSYNVTDADIVTLAKQRQHPLSLADLVK